MWTGIAALRVVLMLPLILMGLFLSLFVPWMPRPVYRTIASRWYGSVLFLTGIRPRYQGSISDEAVLIISNHVSWADILVIGARWPFTFLAMHEISRWPVVGWLSRRVGTLFIHRGRGAQEAISQMAGALCEGRSVIIFPEGRTSPGTAVHRFHPRLFQAAIDAGVKVQPVALVYQDRFSSPGSGTRATYSDEASFLESLWRTLAGPVVEVDVRVFEPFGPLDSREDLARHSRERVMSHPGFKTR